MTTPATVSTPPATSDWEHATSPLRRAVLVYAALVVAPLAGLLWILSTGTDLPLPVTAMAPTPGDSLPGSQIVLRLPVFLTQIVVILTVSRLVGAILGKLGQPRVVGEMVAGLALGPSFLGIIAPAASMWLFPPGTVRFLNALSQIGLVLFMFLIGLEIDLRQISIRRRETLLTSHAGIAVPMFGGAAIALWLYPAFSTSGTSFSVFALFLACAMSVTAFPVLARILHERKLTHTPLGSVAMACAAVADISAWTVLALVVALARGTATTATVAVSWILAGLAAYLALMLLGVRPMLEYFWRRRRGPLATTDADLGQDELAVLLLIVLLSAVATEALDIHALFGAFVAGVVMPRDSTLRSSIRARFNDVLSVLFLPLFFAFAGLSTNVGSLTTLADWLMCAAIIAIAVGGKFGGSMLAARASGISWHNATALGVLMNARGLVELVLLAIGLQFGIITPQLFTMMVIMAVVTTMMTTPLLAYVMAGRASGKVEDVDTWKK